MHHLTPYRDDASVHFEPEPGFEDALANIDAADEARREAALQRYIDRLTDWSDRGSVRPVERRKPKPPDDQLPLQRPVR
jgi:hypothetical protein